MGELTSWLRKTKSRVNNFAESSLDTCSVYPNRIPLEYRAHPSLSPTTHCHNKVTIQLIIEDRMMAAFFLPKHVAMKQPRHQPFTTKRVKNISA